MNAADFYSRRIFGIDYRVWAAMLSISLLSLGLYGYKQIRYDTIGDLSCPTDTIAVDGKKVEVVAGCYLNRYSTFAIQSDNAASVEWNFKDGTNSEKGQFVSHKFTQVGIYRVTATVNGRCTYTAEVEVVEDPFYLERLQRPVVEIYADPTRPTIGSSVKFYCVTDIPSITAYEWRVVNTDEVQMVAEPSFTFKNKGNYAVELVINNNPLKKWRTVIEVTNEILQTPQTGEGNVAGAGMPVDAGQLGKLITEEVTPPSSKDKQPNNNAVINNEGTSKPDTSNRTSTPKAPLLDPNAFKELLQEVIDQEGKELEDLYEYLDYKSSTMVKVNENKGLIPIKDFCKDMRGKKKKKRKIEALSFKIDDKKSIQTIDVKISSGGGFWDSINPFN
jgi:PKD repeat protein